MPPRTQSSVQYWQLRRRLRVEQAAQRIGITPDRYSAVVVLGTEQITEKELRKVLAATGIAEERLRAWKARPRQDTRNPARAIGTRTDQSNNRGLGDRYYSMCRQS